MTSTYDKEKERLEKRLEKLRLQFRDMSRCIVSTTYQLKALEQPEIPFPPEEVCESVAPKYDANTAHYVRCNDEELEKLMGKYNLSITYNESDLPELKMTLAAADAFSAISAIREDVRAIVKYHDLTDEQYKVAEGIYATILTHCQDLQETSGVEF